MRHISIARVTRGGLVGWVLWIVLVHLAPAARGQAPVTCAVDQDRRLSCTVDAQAGFDQTLRQILESGFTNNLVYRVYLFPTDQEEPVSLVVVAFAEVFRLYTDVYYISREGLSGYVVRTDWQDAARVLGRFTVQFEPDIPERAGGYFAVAVLEINPLSPEHLAEARSWIAQSSGVVRLFGGEEQSFFGTLVSLFLYSQQSRAELIRHFRSEPFEIEP